MKSNKFYCDTNSLLWKTFSCYPKKRCAFCKYHQIYLFKTNLPNGAFSTHPKRQCQCQCGAPSKDMRHLLSCPSCTTSCTIQDQNESNDRAVQVAQYWSDNILNESIDMKRRSRFIYSEKKNGCIFFHISGFKSWPHNKSCSHSWVLYFHFLKDVQWMKSTYTCIIEKQFAL